MNIGNSVTLNVARVTIHHFDDPRVEAKRYKACLKNLDANAVGFAYLKFERN